jgi:hypothetical protein
MSHHLLDALARYQEFEEYALKLKHLIEEDDEIELKWPTTDLASLERIQHALSKRIHDVADQLEAAKNESMDRFRRKEVR